MITSNMEMYRFKKLETDGKLDTCAQGDMISKWKRIKIELINGESIEYTKPTHNFTALLKDGLFVISN